jgi:hypothetical protein
MSRLLTLLLGAGIGAAAPHFLDPASGRRRRHDAVGSARYAAGKAKGVVARVTPSSAPDLDDVGLSQKVKTEIFRDAEAPKGDVSVDVQAGVAYLRGTVADPEWIARLGDEAKKVDGIKAVENLLHEPGRPTPAAGPRGAVQNRT